VLLVPPWFQAQETPLLLLFVAMARACICTVALGENEGSSPVAHGVPRRFDVFLNVFGYTGDLWSLNIERGNPQIGWWTYIVRAKRFTRCLLFSFAMHCSQGLLP
jgi:hypothetical protein